MVRKTVGVYPPKNSPLTCPAAAQRLAVAAAKLPKSNEFPVDAIVI